MEACVLVGMLAETPIHVGEGQQDAAIDLPIAREAPTDIPFIPGSGVKGAFREAAEMAVSSERIDIGRVETLFGPEAGSRNMAAGALSFSEARLLALPIRSDRAPFLLVTSPLILRRHKADLSRCARSTDAVEAVLSAAGECNEPKAFAKVSGNARLEDLLVDLDEKNEAISGLAKQFSKTFPGLNLDADWLGERLVVVPDAIMSWLATYAVPVRARNKLNNDKVSENLWYEENLPTDSLMCTLLSPRSNEDFGNMIDDLWKTLVTNDGHAFLQVGGNETVGQGWFRLSRAGEASEGDGQ